MISECAILSVLGLSVGSFLNVCIYRIPRGISLVDSSFCPHCARPLRWYQLVPLVSFLSSKGKCGNCSSRISFQYPFIELIAAVVTVGLFLIYGDVKSYLYVSLFAILMLLVAMIDWKHLIIPNRVIVTGFVAGAVLNIVFYADQAFQKCLASFTAFSVAFFILLTGSWLLKKAVMGMGDVKLSALIGFFLGIQNFLVAFWFATIIGAAYGIVLQSAKGASSDTKLPFGTFLALSSLVTLVFKSSIDQFFESWLILLR